MGFAWGILDATLYTAGLTEDIRSENYLCDAINFRLMNEMEAKAVRKRRNKKKSRKKQTTQINSLAAALMGTVLVVYFTLKTMYLTIDMNGLPAINFLTVRLFWFDFFEAIIFLIAGLVLINHGFGTRNF